MAHTRGMALRALTLAGSRSNCQDRMSMTSHGSAAARGPRRSLRGRCCPVVPIVSLAHSSTTRALLLLSAHHCSLITREPSWHAVPSPLPMRHATWSTHHTTYKMAVVTRLLRCQEEPQEVFLGKVITLNVRTCSHLQAPPRCVVEYPSTGNRL